MLGRAKIPNLPYMNPDDTPLAIDKDYFGDSRSSAKPGMGPLSKLNDGKQTVTVWPKNR
jgi:alpha-N-arabinofuranosidase